MNMLVFLGLDIIALQDALKSNVKKLFRSVYDDPVRKNNVKSEDFKTVFRVKLCSLARKLTHEPTFFKPFLCRRYTYLQYMSKPAFPNIFLK